jgi:ESS family glutamate:Na+ symporter
VKKTRFQDTTSPPQRQTKSFSILAPFRKRLYLLEAIRPSQFTPTHSTEFDFMPLAEPVFSLKLDLIQTLAIAAALYYVGVKLKQFIPLLDRLNIPSAVVGGLLFASIVLVTHDRHINVQFETGTQPLFMVMFFTTIGMSASLPLLRTGGIQVLVFLVISSAFCFIQNFVGMGIARVFDVNPLLGVVAGSVTLVGGPATGLAFAPLFREAGLIGADTLTITSATFGIVCGGIIGGPIGTWLINKYSLRSKSKSERELERELSEELQTIAVEVEKEDSSLVVNMIVASVAMGLGSIVSNYFQSLGWTLPAYIGAMLVASLFRNVDDKTGWLKIDQRTMELVGGIALNIFLVVALMNLKLWELFNLAIPLFAILAVQVIVVVLFSVVVYRIMGGNYDSAVMSSGFIGFVLGTTANAVANMKTLVGKFGASPRAFLVVPMVGAFFIDFVNALVITWFLNWVK